jgi:hypothetical protein
MGSIRQSLQAQPKNTKSTNRIKKKSQIKVCLNFKIEKRQKFVWGLP